MNSGNVLQSAGSVGSVRGVQGGANVSNVSNMSAGSQSGQGSRRKAKSRSGAGQSGSWGERAERKKTPWYTNGAPVSLSLSDELEAFAELTALTPQEQRLREQLFQAVQRVTQQYFPNAKCTLVGSFAAGVRYAFFFFFFFLVFFPSS